MEVASNGVPSVFVKIRVYIQAWKLALSVGTESLTTEVVVKDVVNILGGASRSCNDIFNSDPE